MLIVSVVSTPTRKKCPTLIVQGPERIVGKHARHKTDGDRILRMNRPNVIGAELITQRARARGKTTIDAEDWGRSGI